LTLYHGDVTFKNPDGQHYQVDADSLEDAEYQMLDLAKEDFPDGVEFSVNNIEKVHKD
jgi:hypothetical protein